MVDRQPPLGVGAVCGVDLHGKAVPEEAAREGPGQKQGAAVLRVGQQFGLHLIIEAVFQFGHRDQPVIGAPSAEGVLAGDFHGLPGVAEQGSETDRPLVSGAAPEIAVFQRAVMGGEQNDGVVFALSAEAEGFSGADEIGDGLHPADLFHARGTVPVLGDVVLESAAHRQDRRRFLHDLYGMLRHAGQSQGTVGRAEIPRHQVPGPVLLGDGTASVPGDVERVAGIEVAREKIHVRGDRLRHVVGVRPVGCDLKVGVFPVDLVDIIADVAAEQFPAEFPVFLEKRIPGLYRKTALERDPRFLLKRGDRIGMIV